MKKIDLKKKLGKIPKSVWLLALIVAIGIFLRTYRFHDWLYFYPDQARDVTIVGNYLAGKIPLPLMGFRAASTNFDLGAMYYYFQIASGKLFGVAPNTMAYPDLFFNILSIPLFFYFLKRFFLTDISLALTAIYSVSYFSIEFSRFAWNPNSMPFFVLLYLLSLSKFLAEKKKTRWGWIIGIGIAVGVGIQLHTILIFLLLILSFIAMLFSLIGNWRLWNRWLVIVGIVLLLNTNQVIHETGDNFANTKKLVRLSLGTPGGGGGGMLNNLVWDTVCHVQANAHIISSLGNKVECDFPAAAAEVRELGIGGISKNIGNIIWIVAGFLFSLFGYGLLVYFYRRESNPEKKTFLGVMCLYIGLCFAVLFPIIASESHLRYFLQLFFVPYLFLGFILELVRRKYAHLFLPSIFTVLAVIAGFNFRTLGAEAKLYAANNHSQPQYVVLGELMHMRDYILSQTDSNGTVYMIADGKYMQNYFYPLQFVLKKKNVTLIREDKDLNAIPSGAPLFFLDKRADGGTLSNIKGFPVENHQNFAEIGIYILNSQK